jgi:hypothetical protein
MKKKTYVAIATSPKIQIQANGRRSTIHAAGTKTRRMMAEFVRTRSLYANRAFEGSTLIKVSWLMSAGKPLGDSLLNSTLLEGVLLSRAANDDRSPARISRERR